jgi:endonuclease-3
MPRRPEPAAKPAPAKKRPALPRGAAARVPELLAHLGELYPLVRCELDHDNAFQLLAATILSAQCTDARVNMVTPELFARWPDASALAGFFRNKAKNLIGMARGLVERYGGEVPRSMDELLALPGVARKTANVVLGTAFGIPSGVVVDTHVMRLSGLLGLTRETNPVAIERDLQRLLPQADWIEFSHRLIWHGRRVCVANRPRCAECPLPCPSRQTVA